MSTLLFQKGNGLFRDIRRRIELFRQAGPPSLFDAIGVVRAITPLRAEVEVLIGTDQRQSQ